MAGMRVALRFVALSAAALSSLVLPGAAGGAFPGTNGRIAFVTNRDTNAEIYTANPDGSDPLRLTNTRENESGPAYSPDGTRIAFARSSDIWVMNADGSGAGAITGTEGADSQPAWSPDGSQIVYVSNHTIPATGGTTGPELFIINADGSGTERQVTNTPSNAASQAPVWSPAGDQIAYQSNATTGFDIYTIAPSVTAGFGTLRSANQLNQNYQNPSWSPNGASIAFERGTGTNVGDTTKEIWMMNADGSNPVQITKDSVYDVDPAFSPDGTRIAFESTQAGGGNREIYTAALVPGSQKTNVTNTAATVIDNQPDWGVMPGTAQPPPPPGGGPGPGPGGPLHLADLDNPTLGVDVNVEAVAGTVLIGIPAVAASASQPARAGQKGITFVPLSEAQQIPVGSFLNTRRGTVRMESAANRAGKRQRGSFSRGLFQVLQSRKRSARGLTDLVLKGSSFRGCRARGGSRDASASGLSRRRIRRLRANARGRFRTRGRNSSATVRGTKWSVTDRCDGTLTKVSRGRVVVRDFRRKRNILVRAGKSYLAKARR
jgi:Tol biopolymer transport system component